MKKTVPKILLYGSLPPPYTGQSSMFIPVVDALPANQAVILNITRFSSPVVNTVYTMFSTFLYFLIYRFRSVYFTPSRSPAGAVKDLPLLLLGRFTGKRMVAHLHGANFRTFYENCGMLKPVLKYAYQKVDTAVVLLEDMRHEFIAFPHMKIAVVSNCYDRQFDLEKDIKIPKKQQVLYFSALMCSKGILEFLEAAEFALKRNTAVEFVIAGAFCPDPSMNLDEITSRFMEHYQRLLQLFPGRISYLGLVTGQQKIRLFNESAIFVLPSWHPSEAMPVSILEAMRTGNAIIATRHNFLPQLIRPENGILVEPGSGIEIANAIRSLLSNRESLIRMQEYNIRFALKHYNPESFTKAIRELLS